MKTKRLTLRDLTHSDARRIALLAGDLDVARMTARIPHPYTEIEAEEWIKGIDEGEYVQGIDFEGYLIGLVGYTLMTKKIAELGYWIGKPWWGRGFATEAAEAVLWHCFYKSGFSRITCTHFIDNPASARVIEKLGFTCVGLNSAYCLARKKNIDAIIYEKKRPLMSFFWMSKS